MKIAICDDDEVSCKIISVLLDMYSKDSPHHELVYSVYAHADDLLEAAKKTGGFDIYILDIIMPDTNGVELGMRLRENGFDGKIIYLTSSEEYVFDSFRTQPFNYILKPVEPKNLFPVLDSAIDTVNCKKEKSIIVKTVDGNIKLSFDSIMYAELVRRTVIYHLTNGRVIESVTIRTSFSEAVSKLIADKCFAMCGASVIVNLLHITASNSKELQLRDGSSIQLSRKQLAELRTKWMEYWQEQEEEI